MARVDVYRFGEEELEECNGELTLCIDVPQRVARVDSAESAARLLEIAGLKRVDPAKRPLVASVLREACAHFGLPRPVGFMRGALGTFAITRTPSPKRPANDTGAVAQ